jgi:hypothetical protein
MVRPFFSAKILPRCNFSTSSGVLWVETKKIKGGLLMRKKIAMLLGSIFSLSLLAGCGQAEPAAVSCPAAITGWIVEVTDSCVYMVPDADGVPDGIGELTGIGLNASWQDADGAALPTTALAPGQQILCQYEDILETWPARLSGSVCVTVTGEQADVSALAAQWDDWNAEQAAEDPYHMPTLQLLYTNGVSSVCARPLQGTSSWTYDNGDGTASGINQDSAHPLQWTDDHLVSVDPDHTDGGTLTLSFVSDCGEPETVSVTRWDASARGTDAVSDGEPVELSAGGSLLLQADSVYEVCAVWKTDTASGTITWAFQTAKS